MISNLRPRWDLLKVLTVSSWRSRYRNSVLGFTWGILEPLSVTFVFVVVFSLFTAGIYTGPAPYPIFVLLGTILWTVFAQGTTQGGTGVLLRAGLVKKLYFPREYISYAYIFTILVTAAVNLAIFSVLYVVYGLSLSLPALLFPLILGVLILLVVGVSLTLASIFIRLEDLRYLWQLVIRVGIFLSPVIYESTVVPAQFAFWYNLNPMVGIITAARETLLYGAWPSMWSLLYPALAGIFLFATGFFLFKRSEHLFAERL